MPQWLAALVYLPLLVPVLAAAAARPLAARLEPRLATWLLTATTVALAAFSLGDEDVAGVHRPKVAP